VVITADEYLDWLKTVQQEDEMAHASNRRVAENHQRQAEEVIGNIAALATIRDGDKLIRELLGNQP
jgi:hypothetical protein